MRGAAGAGARSDLAISNCARPDHEQDAGGAEICCRPDRRPGMTQDLAGAAPARGRSPAVDRVGSSKITFSTPARAVRSPFCLTCLRTAPTGGEEGGEPAGTVCARSPRAGGRQLTERGARSRSESGCPVPQIAKSNKKNECVLADSRKYAVSSVLGARPRPRPRTGPATCRANWLVGGGAASPSERRKQCMQLCAQTELVAQADACAVLRTWFSRRGRPRGETSREHSRQGPQGVPRDHTAFSISSGFRAPCSPLGARCTRHTVSPETLPCPSIVKCDLVCNCHLRTAVHL